MTSVEVFRKNGQYRSFVCTGHTDYSEEGADIVCAGVSAIVITTINSLTDLLHEDVDCEYDEENGGYIAVNIRHDLSEKGSFLIEHMLYGLEWVRRVAGEQYLRYEIKEV